MSLNLFIIGPSGCGKSTQAKLVAAKYHLAHFSVGQLFRHAIEAKTDIGLQAKTFVDQGLWVPDDLTIDLLTPSLADINHHDFIIDGFHRVLNQGKIIEHYLKSKNEPFSLLIHLKVVLAEIQARRQRLGESFQDKDRTDNQPADIAQRQRSYDDTINPIKKYFHSMAKLFEVDGNRPIEPIFADICRAIDKIHH